MMFAKTRLEIERSKFYIAGQHYVVYSPGV